MEEAETVKTILSENWTPTNTDNITPAIDLIYNRSNIDARKTDYVLTYQSASVITPAGAKTFNHQSSVSIDLRAVIQSRFKKHVTEIKRIIEGKYLSPGGSYHRLFLVRENDLSDRTRGLYRKVIDVYILKDLKEVMDI